MKELACPCGAILRNVQSMESRVKPTLGDIFLCGDCARASKYGLLGLSYLTQAELAKLQPSERTALRRALRDIRRHIAKN